MESKMITEYMKGYEAGYKVGSAEKAKEINEVLIHELDLYITFHTMMLDADPEHVSDNQMAIHVLETLCDSIRKCPYE